MKKIVIALALVIVITVVGYYQYESKNDFSYINTFNNNLEFELKLLNHPENDSVKDILTKDYQFKGGFGCYVFNHISNNTELTFSGFPDAIDTYGLTNISTSNSKLKIYGCKVGDSKEGFIKKLKAKGFVVVDNNSSNVVQLQLKNLNILLTCNNSIVERLTVYILSTNRSDVIY